ncbi:MAG: ribosome-associated translation inhibitor RaiA [Actinomycetia bacterium]|nr:ribosome-associated translation inhibitor RaiA [Actinomycetes bacterium]
MSTQSVNSGQSADGHLDVPNAHLQVTGRNVEIPDHYRRYVGQKLARAERIDQSIHRFDVELAHENNRRQRKNCQHVEITAHSGRGPVVRGEGRADTFYGAFEAAAHKLESRLRRGKDRRKVHYGDKTPQSVRRAVGRNAPVAPLDLADAFNPDGLVPETPAPAQAQAQAPVQAPADDHEPGHIVRVKEHPAKPMTVDDALYEMELVGHDFFLFHDEETDRPSVVYRRHAYDYGLIRLS